MVPPARAIRPRLASASGASPAVTTPTVNVATDGLPVAPASATAATPRTSMGLHTTGRPSEASTTATLRDGSFVMRSLAWAMAPASAGPRVVRPSGRRRSSAADSMVADAGSGAMGTDGAA